MCLIFFFHPPLWLPLMFLSQGQCKCSMKDEDFLSSCFALWLALYNLQCSFLLVILKGSYDVAKKNIIWCNAMFIQFKVQKTHFPHTVHYCCSSMLCLSETCRFLQSSSFWEARYALIGQLSIALWLAEYLKRVMEMLRTLPYCDGVSRCNETKTITYYKRGIFCIQWVHNYLL